MHAYVQTHAYLHAGACRSWPGHREEGQDPSSGRTIHGCKARRGYRQPQEGRKHSPKRIEDQKCPEQEKKKFFDRQKKKQKLKRKKKTFSRPRRRQSPFAHPLEIANIRDPRLAPTLCTAPDVIEKAGQLFYWCSIDKRSTVPQTGSAGKRTKLRFPHKHRACK